LVLIYFAVRHWQEKVNRERHLLNEKLKMTFNIIKKARVPRA